MIYDAKRKLTVPEPKVFTPGLLADHLPEGVCPVCINIGGFWDGLVWKECRCYKYKALREPKPVCV
jgi:hypothetical protein